MDPKDKDDAMLLKLLLCVEFRPDDSDWREVAANIVVALGYDREAANDDAFLESHAMTPKQCRDFAGKTKALFGRTAAGRFVFTVRSGSQGHPFVLEWDNTAKRLVAKPIAPQVERL